MRFRRVVGGALALIALTGCSQSMGGESHAVRFTLPVGSTQWDDVTAPAWYYDGTLHVGEETVEIDGSVDAFVLGATGAYWMNGETLMFTSVEGRAQKVAEVDWNNMAVSADRSVFATADQSSGPANADGVRVMQVAAFDTRTGEQLYRGPDEASDEDELDSWYGEHMPLLLGVSEERVFFNSTTINLSDSSVVPSGEDSEGAEIYEGYAETLFVDGYAVGLEKQGRRGVIAPSEMFGLGRLSPDRTTVFGYRAQPSPAVAYDAKTGEPRPIRAMGDEFALAGWSDKDTFFGVASGEGEAALDPNIDARSGALQVVTCEVRTLACTPVSPEIPTHDKMPLFLMEGETR